MLAPSEMARRLSTGRKPDCVNYKLLGNCDDGECSFRHVVNLAYRSCTGYVPIPERLTVGRNRHNIRSALREAHLQSKCVVVPMRPQDKQQVKVVAIDQETLKEAQKILGVLFTQVYPMGPSWCYLHAKSITVNALLEFREYKGRVPKQMNQKATKLFEVFSQPQASDEASADVADTSLEELEMLNPKQSPLDSWDQLHSALDSLHGPTTEGKIPTEEIAKTLPAGSHTRARIMLEYRGDIKTNLQGALEWMCKPENRQPGLTAKLEASTASDEKLGDGLGTRLRFGKTLWYRLPEDVLASDKGWSVKTFAEFVCSDTNHSQIFDTDVKKENASSLRTLLQELSDEPTNVLETFDLKFVSRGAKLDLRLRNNGGRLEVVVVKKNDRKVVVFDVLCLHTKHDIRLGLNRFESIPNEDSIIVKLFKTLKMPTPETLEFVPHADEWVINFIRHKRRETFFLDEKYMVTVTEVKECCIKLRPRDERITIGPGDYDKPHMEVEFHSIIWECMFGKAIGLSPERSLALFMETPAISPKVVSLIPPDPWDVAAILRDMDEVFENLDTLNESLGTI